MPPENNSKILITGSSGTIGTRLFEKLLEQNYNVAGFDKRANKWSPHMNKLTINGDLLCKDDIKKIPAGFDTVIHLAANPRVYDLVLKPNLALENIISTYNILDFCRKNNVKNIIFSSSREVYANRNKAVAGEADADVRLCESPYAASKISGEALVYSFCKCYGMNYIVCRFSNVYGMYDESERFVPLMIRKMTKNEDVEIYGRDKMLDFTYIDDCIGGIILCIRKFYSAKNNIFNIASGRGEKLLDVAKLLKEKMESKSRIFIKKSRPGEVVKFSADISKAKGMLKFEPEYFINRGVKMAVNWYKNI